MGYTCCVPKCRSGYKSAKRDIKGSRAKVPIFKFPRDENLRQKWMRAIPRMCWGLSKNHRICGKHFSPDDFFTESSDTNLTRLTSRTLPSLLRVRLKPGAIPHIFNVSSNNEDTPNNSQSNKLSRPALYIKEEWPTESSIHHFSEVETLSELKKMVQAEMLPPGYTVQYADDSLRFHFIEIPENITESPKLAISVLITEDLQVLAFVKSKPVPSEMYEHVIPTGFVQNSLQVVDVLDVCKNLYTSSEDTGYINLAMSTLEEYLATKTDCMALKEDHGRLLRFIIEQLKLMQNCSEEHQYSTDTIILAFLWRLTSPTLYNNLTPFFHLPSVSQLNQVSCKVGLESETIDSGHLREHAKYLSPRERIVTLIVDNLNLVPGVECIDGSTNENKSTKSVLTFTVQSICSKYKDVACMIPIERLDTVVLRKWLQSVMKALDEFLLITAVSICNQACIR